jgi:hypothetical protein
LFERLFSGGVGGGTDEETANVLGASKTMGKSMLDVIKEDANSLMQRVGSNDRARVDQHLEGLRALERRLDYEVVCEEPENPAASDFGDEGSNEQKEAKHELMIDLLATALACDLSRVFSYEWSATQSGAVYWEVDSSSEHHPLTHKGSSPELRKVVTFIMKNYASLARRLRDTPEGAGNLLDNTLILGTSEHSNADIHNMVDHPFVFLGKAGGAIRAGLHHRDPKTDHWTVNRGTSNLNGPRVLLTAVRAVGVEIEEIGQDGPSGDRRARDSITELLT